MDQFQYCENSRVIIVQKSVSLSLAMEWIPARPYFNIADLPISWMPAIRISLSIDVCCTSVVSTTFIKSKKNINYFVWWIIWHFVRTNILLNLSKLTNDALYSFYFLLLLSITTLTLLTKALTTGSKYVRTDSSKCKFDLQILNLRCLET